MGFLSSLDVINSMLATMGELPLNSIDEDHPLAGAGIRMLRIANSREQAKSWWFNRELVNLAPDAVSGYIYVPEDAIRVDPTKGTLNYVQRGNRLYNSYSPPGNNPYVFKYTVQCWLVRLIPFEDLPPSAAHVVSLSAQIDFQKSYDADRLKYEQLQQDYAVALAQLNAEHIRNQNANLIRNTPAARALHEIAPTLGRHGLPIYT